MAMQSASPLLPAKNVRAAMEWYRDVLGFADAWIYEDEGYAIVKRDDAEIHLFEMAINPRKSDFMVYLRVNDIEGLYDEFRALDLIHPNAPLQDRPWGQREFAVLDPNGALLTFGQGLDPAQRSST